MKFLIFIFCLIIPFLSSMTAYGDVVDQIIDKIYERGAAPEKKLDAVAVLMENVHLNDELKTLEPEKTRQLILGLYQLSFTQGNPEGSLKVAQLAEKCFTSGLNVGSTFQSGIRYSETETFVESILSLWIQLTHRFYIEINDSDDLHNTLQVLDFSSKSFFDLFFRMGLSPELKIEIIDPPPGFPKYTTLSQAQYSNSNYSNIIKYFISTKEPALLFATDEAGMNLAMTAAYFADFDVLRSIQLSHSPEVVARLFNSKSTEGFHPTVLHFAIASVYSGSTSAAAAYKVMSYLVDFGADPLQRSMYHDLKEEIHFGMSIAPQYKIELQKLATLLANDPNFSSPRNLYMSCNQIF